MVLFNYSAKELTAKIVYYGPGLGGKTTCLEYIYKTLPAKVKGKMLSLSTQTDRTLFFDFLPVDLGTIYNWKVKIQLYTVPGQVFYDATRKIVLKGADGVVFVVDSQNNLKAVNIESWENFKENLKVNNLNFETMPLVIQYNKRDLKNIMPVEELQNLINARKAPYFETIATEGKGVIEALKTITKLVLQNLQKQYTKIFMEEKKEEPLQPSAEIKEKKIKPPPNLIQHQEQLSNAEEKMYAKPKYSQEDEMASIEMHTDEEIAELPISDDDLSLDDSQWKKIELAKENTPSPETYEVEPPPIIDSDYYDDIQEIEEIEELEIVDDVEKIPEIEEKIKEKKSSTKPTAKLTLEETIKTKNQLSDTWKSSKKDKKSEVVTQKFLDEKIKEITTAIEIKEPKVIDISAISQLKSITAPIEIKYDKEKNILYLTIKLALKLK